MRQSTETIEGRKYTVSPLPAAASLRMWVKLVKRHGAALSALFSENKESDAIEKFCMSLDEDLIDELRRTFMQVSTVDDKPVSSDATYGAAFVGRIMDQFRWLYFCLKSEYGDVFTGLVQSAQGLGENLGTQKS